MDGDAHRRGLIDTNVVILRRRIPPEALPAEMAISVVTLAELSAGPHHVRGPDGHAERARRLDVLQRAENEFDPIPFDADAARMFGRLTAAVLAAGRQPRRRTADLMIAAIAAVDELPLFTTNPDDYAGLGELLTVVPVAVPASRPIVR
ncbi:MAG: type II toxin-antitoxin system VapC family toxin [Pseudonocardia sp.]